MHCSSDNLWRVPATRKVTLAKSPPPRKELNPMRQITRSAFVLLSLVPVGLAAQQPAPQPTTEAQAPNRDTSYITCNTALNM